MKGEKTMEKVISTWSCPVCGKPTMQIIKVGTSAGIADLCKQKFLQDFGGFREVTPHHQYAFCKDHFKKDTERG